MKDMSWEFGLDLRSDHDASRTTIRQIREIESKGADASLEAMTRSTRLRIDDLVKRLSADVRIKDA